MKDFMCGIWIIITFAFLAGFFVSVFDPMFSRQAVVILLIGAFFSAATTREIIKD